MGVWVGVKSFRTRRARAYARAPRYRRANVRLVQRLALNLARLDHALGQRLKDGLPAQAKPSAVDSHRELTPEASFFHRDLTHVGTCSPQRGQARA